MPEIETLFVRIDADLSAFKRGIADAKRETRGFANEARRTFADIGSALDLSPFRRELAESERAAKQAADRMRKAFAEVGKKQEKAMQRAIQDFTRLPGRRRPGRVGFEGPRDGGQFLPASFTGDTLLGGAGLEAFRRQVIEAGGPLDGLTGKFADLTRAAGGFEARGGSLAELLDRTNTLFNDQVGAVRLLDAALPELGQALTSVFEAAAEGGRGLERVVEGLGQSLLDAFQGAAFEGRSFREVFKGLAVPGNASPLSLPMAAERRESGNVRVRRFRRPGCFRSRGHSAPGLHGNRP